MPLLSPFLTILGTRLLICFGVAVSIITLLFGLLIVCFMGRVITGFGLISFVKAWNLNLSLTACFIVIALSLMLSLSFVFNRLFCFIRRKRLCRYYLMFLSFSSLYQQP